ncbi:hypothetical protein At15955_05060 [Agrobacterium tumefaciens]|jgi:hypothetical protein|nr:hypothetical protein Ach5_08110 [Agrobacterium tumefaciens]AYM15494.1 hypothetical protein At15955_05060 [Agrobacterium tumefaciens]AYM66730.1 hypothetical protein AtA6_05110 [Agrobacterium tumefaciens]
MTKEFGRGQAAPMSFAQRGWGFFGPLKERQILLVPDYAVSFSTGAAGSGIFSASSTTANLRSAS